MRVNPNFVPDIVSDLQQSQSTLNTLLQEVATGKSVNQPSDNPSASSQMVQNSLESSDAATYTQNISSTLANVQSASSVLSSIVTQLSQAVSLGTEGANGTNNSTDLADLSQQVQSILSTVIPWPSATT
jgi:flagellar hook-associated protein 3 FlgL